MTRDGVSLLLLTDVQELIASLGDSMDLVPSAQPSQSQDNTDIARAVSTAG